MRRPLISIFMTIIALALGLTSRAEAPADVLREGLAIGSVGRYGRGPVHTDALEAQIVAGAWRFPEASDTVTLPDGTAQRWSRIRADKDGVFGGPALRGGYVAFKVAVPVAKVMLLDASGHNMVYVNGEPRAGDVYSTGWTLVPIALRAGDNTLLFHCSRGTLKAKLTQPASETFFNTRDLTVPDLVVGERPNTVGAVIVVNATPRTVRDCVIECIGVGLQETKTLVPSVPPMTSRKVAFRLRGEAPIASGNKQVTLRLVKRSGGRVQDTAGIGLQIRKPEEPRKITFVSAIDGSVQYYALNPAHPRAGKSEGLALFLSLHGAGVEAIGQASAYAPKTWGSLVAPTNRRPYGFDWEDWGRLDALEVLDLAMARYRPDPRRIYLTGHSMGGHGTWYIGATYPDKFAAIGPSAGWISLFTYAGAARQSDPSPLQSLLLRPMQPSDTLSLLHNYAQEGIYILHGAADDNVPITEAREMKRQLAAFHTDVTMWEQPGAGHWWGTEQAASDERYGTACVDWKPMFEFFAAHKRPLEADVRNVSFTTADPGLSAWCDWAGVLAQEHPLKTSVVQIACDPDARRFSGTTENVLRLSLRMTPIRSKGRLTVKLDGQTMPDIAFPEKSKQLWLIKRDGHWEVETRPAADNKGPERCGPFKQAFRNRMVFVYGTNGNPDENAWAYARARYDAETFWYRGNGAVDIIADADFRTSADRDRSVVLYGNADTNRAWKSLMAGSPVSVTRRSVTVGGKETAGADVACLFVRPRPGSDRALVAAVSGTGLPGMRFTDRLPYFMSGVEYPDCLVVRSDMLSKGISGVVAAGFFGADWSVEKGEFAWQ